MQNNYPTDVTVRVRARGTTKAADYALLAEAVADAAMLQRAGIEITQHCAYCGATEHGRPFVTAPPDLADTVHVSLSRAGGLTAMAVSFDGPVGIDIEDIAAVRRAGFDEVAFNAAERSELAHLAAAEGDHARAVLWTRKEAILKLTGDGLRVDPRELNPSVAGLTPLSWPGARVDMTHVRLTPITLGHAGLVGTLAHLPKEDPAP
ncbi:4'-phosphopantetheinyl transferase family protein [Cryobacterium psychrophilum]|uniref:4'-phosphopantetheinyl transferase superfamily protein n=1 Tax=Cryobacterium psychrophilum TaxID=41988 RepID=A0A4Y8KRX3_9MICO|nr:4'-phosphopantetheinyl transferase superfamily protein [Cryobacterium psychrophilum]TDW29424.1 4'-phosphopantetheinyl transferase superfamily protein [Cryobacterium psychrophilum]TFD81433.1 4'-phosphopantetheinyl transferase superfamily protein [Cryobacterium psychrophilum]